MAEAAEECIQRIQANEAVKAVFILNDVGQIIESTISEAEDEERYARQVFKLVKNTRDMIQELHNDDSLNFLRIRTEKEEIMIAPEPNNKKYTLVVLHHLSKNS